MRFMPTRKKKRQAKSKNRRVCRSLRVFFGALVLLPMLFAARRHFPLSIWPKLFFIGAINTAIPFVLFAWASARAPAGVSSIANAMTVLFTALAAVLFFGESIALLQFEKSKVE